jgi:hypothetical protein
LSFFRVVLKATKKSKTREEKKMKKLFVIFAVAVFVLFTGKIVVADDNIPAILEGIGNFQTLTDEECWKIGGLLIPPDAKGNIFEIIFEEPMLPPGIYLVFGGKEKVQVFCLEGTDFLKLPKGTYKIYTIPARPSPAMEMLKRRVLKQM